MQLNEIYMMKEVNGDDDGNFTLSILIHLKQKFT